MEKKVIFRDYQEQQAQDHNDLQDFVEQSLDHLVLDAVTATRRYAGFTTVKTTQTEVQVAAGRFVDVNGVIYSRSATLTQNMLTYLPAVAKRIVLLSVYGSVTETEIEERDYLVDVSTGRTEPKAVATFESRDAVLALTSGAESADPQAPSVPIGHAPVALIELDTTSIVSVTMQTTYQVVSTEALDARSLILEAFRRSIEPRVSALASDLAALARKVAEIVTAPGSAEVNLTRIHQDLALLKEKVDLPANYSDYGSDNFLGLEHSDSDNSLGYGYDCRVEGGLSFAAANEDESELSLFSPLDPNVKVTDGLVLPAYADVEKIVTGDKVSQVAIAQYGFQLFPWKWWGIPYLRIRHGVWWPGYPAAPWMPYGVVIEPYAPVWALFPTMSWASFKTFIMPYINLVDFHKKKWWKKHWKDYWYGVRWPLVVTSGNITGAQIAQTFLVANDMWATKLGFYLVASGGNENIHLTLCELTAGQPDMDKVVMTTSVSYSNLVAGWNYATIKPTFLERGVRYALVVTANANHIFGTSAAVPGGSYLDGTMFYSTDGVYYLGDLNRDLMIEIYAAQFTNPQATVELAPINLDGGIRAVDLLASMTIPESTDLIFEIKPSGSDWTPLNQDNIDNLNNAPPLFQFRARMIGTRDIGPGLVLTGSRMHVSRPKTTFRHVSESWTLAGATTSITVKVTLQDFDETPHNLTAVLWNGAESNAPDTTVDEVIDTDNSVMTRTWVFSPTSCSSFVLELNGATNSAASIFTVREMLFWTT